MKRMLHFVAFLGLALTTGVRGGVQPPGGGGEKAHRARRSSRCCSSATGTTGRPTALTRTPVFAKRGIDLTYTDKLDDLTDEAGPLRRSHDLREPHQISAEQEKALLEYVESGGFVPVHCAATASSIRRSTSRWSAPSSAARHRHVHHGHREARHPIMKGFNASRATTRRTYTPSTTRRDRNVLETRAEGELKSRGRGFASRARVACSTPRGGMIRGPGATPVSTTCWNAAFGGRAVKTRRRVRNRPNLDRASSRSFEYVERRCRSIRPGGGGRRCRDPQMQKPLALASRSSTSLPAGL